MAKKEVDRCERSPKLPLVSCPNRTEFHRIEEEASNAPSRDSPNPLVTGTENFSLSVEEKKNGSATFGGLVELRKLYRQEDIQEEFDQYEKEHGHEPSLKALLDRLDRIGQKPMKRKLSESRGVLG
jgi:hypothetical protein